MNLKPETRNLKPETSKTELVRGLTLIAAMSVVVGNVIGTGVFLKARVMTCNVGTPGKVLAVYVIAGLLSLAGALSYAELAAMMPRAGGAGSAVRFVPQHDDSRTTRWYILFHDGIRASRSVWQNPNRRAGFDIYCYGN